MADRKTLEEALAEMEARNGQAAELRAKQAPDLIAEAVKRTELKARLSALPLEQRKQVMEAAGLNNLSVAHVSITRADLRKSTHPRTRAQSPEIDWAFWRGMHIVTLWQACALVVGLNPDELNFNPKGWMAGPGAAPIFDDRSFPSQAARERFGKALRLAESAVSFTGGPIVAQGTAHSGSKQRCGVLLSQVLAHFVGCDWAGIPEQLHAIAQEAAPVETQAPTETKEQRQDRRLADCEAAGLVMPKSYLSRLPDGVGRMADLEGVERQSFTPDIKEALKRREATKREG